MAGLDEAAFSEFYRRTARSVWTYVYRVTSHAADAEDIVQEAFCRLLRADVTLATEDERRAYLFRIAGNLVADRWRRDARERPGGHEDRRSVERMSQASTDMAREHANEDVTRTFARLAARERALLWLAYVEGSSHEEIASALGLARGSVKVLLFRARKRLRDLLEARGLIQRT